MRSLLVILSVLAAIVGPRASWSQSWIDISPASGPIPEARSLASAIFDSQERRMVIFGGEGSNGRLNDVWAFDLDSHQWTDLTPSTGPAPAVRRTPVSVYDPDLHHMVTWSGQGIGNGFFNDVWAFDLSTNTWTEHSPTGGPPNIRYGAAGVFDPISGDLVTFAGFTNQGRFNDVWRFNSAAVTWTDASPGAGPLKRCLHSASYDSQNHRMIMYGGQNAGALGDIWAFDLSLGTWTELTPASGPPGRWFAAHVYDANNRRATVFAGNANGVKKNDVWVFDLTTNAWHELSPTGTPPSAREGAVAVYDRVNDRIVVFGGRSNMVNNDVWALNDLSDTVTGIGSGPLPQRATLGQNYPNPFNPGTTINYSIVEPTPVTLAIYNAKGVRVRTLVNRWQASSDYAITWDGMSNDGVEVASGIYFYRLDAGDFSVTKKMVVLR